MQEYIEKFAKSFYSSYIAHYLSIDEDCDYMNNGLYLIINRRSEDYTAVEKEAIKIWTEIRIEIDNAPIKKLEIQENKIIFKF